MNTLVHWCWPGNALKLKNLVERLVILYRENNRLPRIEYEFLPPELKGQPVDNSPSYIQKSFTPTGDVVGISLSTIEEQHIREVYSRMQFNKSHTARNLGISRNTLKKKLTQYGIEDH